MSRELFHNQFKYMDFSVNQIFNMHIRRKIHDGLRCQRDAVNSDSNSYSATLLSGTVLGPALGVSSHSFS